MKRPMQPRTAFSLVEVSVACVLTAFLAIMLSTTWRVIMPSTTDLIIWAQLFQEMQIATTTIGRDVGGALPDNGCVGTKQQGLLLACQRTTASGVDHLQLCFDGIPPYGVGSQGCAADGHPPDWTGASDTVIDYNVTTSGALVRSNSSGGSVTVANNVDAMDVIVDDSVTPSIITITLTFKYHFPHAKNTAVDSWKAPLVRKCTLVLRKQP
jgi:hypothetical protein